MNEQCKHEYKEVVSRTQEAVTGHWDYKDHVLAILRHDKVNIFCLHCGEFKELKHETPVES